MKNRPSHTAADVAVLRALNTVIPKPERILEDPLSLAMLPSPWKIGRWLFGTPLRHLAVPLCRKITQWVTNMPGGVELVALRYRWLDERLAAAIASGIQQVVILGAGYDFRSGRPEYREIHFVEIDHPNTQHAKLALLKQHGVSYPNTDYLEVDFMGDWVDTVAQSGLIRPEPTLVIWEGVIYYLNDTAVRTTLRAFTRLMPAGGMVIFDALPPENETHALGRTRQYVAMKGEPMLWGGSMDTTLLLLTEHGITPQRSEPLADYLRAINQDSNRKLPVAPVLEEFFMVEASWPAQSQNT